MNKQQILEMLQQAASHEKQGSIKLHVDTRDIVKTEEISFAIKEGRMVGIESGTLTGQWIEHININVSANRINDIYEVSWY